MFTRFRSNLKKRVAKIANIAALISLFTSVFTFAPMMPVHAVNVAMDSLTTTLAQPTYSTNFLTDPTYTNANYLWNLSQTFTASSTDPCISATSTRCVEIYIILQDTGTTTTYAGQEWMSTVTTSDFIWGGPSNSFVSSTTRTDDDSNGRFETLQVMIGCSATCTFSATTTYSLSIVNYPLKNPQTPGAYTAGSYTSLTQIFNSQEQIALALNPEILTSVVAIGKGLTVTASVDPSLTFSVSGVASSTAFYSDTSTVTTVANPDACSFGALYPGTPKICLFNLNIATNASNGYAIYVVQDQNMVFGVNTIKQFKDGTRVDDSAATYWTSPSSTQLAHLGYSSNDTSVFAATTTSLWAGIPNIATSAQAPVITGLVADSSTPNTATYTYAIKVESASTLPQGSSYTHREYFMVVGNF